MYMKKRILALLLILVLVFCGVSCADTESDDGKPPVSGNDGGLPLIPAVPDN